MPDWELKLWGEYLAREPSPEERIEYAIASLTSIFVNSKTKKRAKKHTMDEFLLFKKAWQYTPNSGDPDVDSDISLIMASFGSRLEIVHR